MDEPRYAYLEGHEVVPLDISGRDEALREWARKFEDTETRRVAVDEVGEVRVSTVFLVINHQHYAGPPLWFETMVFGGDFDQEMDRYPTWESAKAGHDEVVRRLKEGLAPWEEEEA